MVCAEVSNTYFYRIIHVPACLSRSLLLGRGSISKEIADNPRPFLVSESSAIFEQYQILCLSHRFREVMLFDQTSIDCCGWDGVGCPVIDRNCTRKASLTRIIVADVSVHSIHFIDSGVCSIEGESQTKLFPLECCNSCSPVYVSSDGGIGI